MNQEQNNLNNFNTQDNNGIPNNPLNQGMSVNQQNTQQSINSFESVNTSNQSFQNNQNMGQMNNIYQQSNISQQQAPPSKNKIIKILAIIGGVIVGFIILLVVIFGLTFLITSKNSKKLVCNSNEGKITIIYNEKTINGYVANRMSYDLDNQKKYAEQIGIDAYIEEFSTWFSNNTSGTCTIDSK